MIQEENKTLLIGILNGNIEYSPVKEVVRKKIKKQPPKRKNRTPQQIRKQILETKEMIGDNCSCKQISEKTNPKISASTIDKYWKDMIKDGTVLSELPYEFDYTNKKSILRLWNSFRDNYITQTELGVPCRSGMNATLSQGLVAIVYSAKESPVGDLVLNGEIIEVKSTTMENQDLSSFSPKDYSSRDIYLLKVDVYNQKYETYIFDKTLLDTIKVNKEQNLKDQREQDKRPRTGILKLSKLDKSGNIYDLLGENL